MHTKRLATIVAINATIALVFCLLPQQADSATTGSPQITWLAAGDSFASGQGLPHPTGTCARGTGQNGSGSTWAVTAAYILKSSGIDIANGSPDLVACTGAVSADFFQNDDKVLGGKKHMVQWTPQMHRFNLVTFSFGGDDIGFASIMAHCEEFGCPSNADVRKKINEMATTGIYDKSLHIPPYPTFLKNVATEAVTKGGNIVVMGYPELVEDVGLWSTGRTTCAGMSAGEDQRVRGWAGDLNATIGAAVAKVNALPTSERNNVHLTYLDPVSGQSADGISNSDPNLFEPSSGTRHELCSQGGQPRLNNEIKTDKSHSFHPNQDGENAMGALAAEVIGQLDWPWSPTGTCISPAVATKLFLASGANGITGTEQVEQISCTGPWAEGTIVSGPNGAGVVAFHFVHGSWAYVASSAFYSEFCSQMAQLGAPASMLSDCPAGSTTQTPTTVTPTTVTPTTVTPTTTSPAPCTDTALAQAAIAWEPQQGDPDGTGSTMQFYACVGTYAGVVYSPGDDPGTGATMALEARGGTWTVLGTGNLLPSTVGIPADVYQQLLMELSNYSASNTSLTF